MRKIIDGKLYDTDTATKICEIYCPHHRGDFQWHDTALYRTKNNAFFLAGRGGAASMWARAVPSGSTGGEGLRAVSIEEAKRLVEQNADVATYEEAFGAPAEG